jgi:hypothetical protein
MLSGQHHRRRAEAKNAERYAEDVEVLVFNRSYHVYSLKRRATSEGSSRVREP